MPLYDFADEAGHVTEAIQGMGVESIPCGVCGAMARRQAVYRIAAVVREGATRVKNAKGKYLVSDFQEASQELDYAAKRDGVELPNLYKAGIKEAKRRGAKMRV